VVFGGLTKEKAHKEGDPRESKKKLEGTSEKKGSGNDNSVIEKQEGTRPGPVKSRKWGERRSGALCLEVGVAHAQT